MTIDFQPISRERHQHKKWLRPRGLAFSANQHIVPVVGAELSHAARTLPLAFVRGGESTNLVALIGLQPDKNLMLSQDGRWLGAYVPAFLRAHPFRLARVDAEQLVLCVDEGGGNVVDTAIGEDGVAFFNENGETTNEMQQILQFLTSLQQNQIATSRGIQALDAASVLEPWPVSYESEGRSVRADGLLRVNEAALNELNAEALYELRSAGALAIAYAQMISMGNLPGLVNLSKAHEQAKQQKFAIPENSFLPEDDGSLKIDWNTLFSKE